MNVRNGVSHVHTPLQNPELGAVNAWLDISLIPQQETVWRHAPSSIYSRLKENVSLNAHQDGDLTMSLVTFASSVAQKDVLLVIDQTQIYGTEWKNTVIYVDLTITGSKQQLEMKDLTVLQNGGAEKVQLSQLQEQIW